MRRAPGEVAKDVEKAISRHCKTSGVPNDCVQMTSVGEQTGKLDEILNRVAGYFETESSMRSKIFQLRWANYHGLAWSRGRIPHCGHHCSYLQLD
jgi:hypothetical protein